MKKFFNLKDSLIAFLISLFTIFLKGVIHINSQQIPSMRTYSGGFPIAWFEFYYPKDVPLTVNYVINHLSNHYLIELLALFLNTAFFIFVLRSLRQLYHRLRSQ